MVARVIYVFLIFFLKQGIILIFLNRIVLKFVLRGERKTINAKPNKKAHKFLLIHAHTVSRTSAPYAHCSHNFSFYEKNRERIRAAVR
jgi:hypothetical protein